VPLPVRADLPHDRVTGAQAVLAHNLIVYKHIGGVLPGPGCAYKGRVVVDNVDDPCDLLQLLRIKVLIVALVAPAVVIIPVVPVTPTLAIPCAVPVPPAAPAAATTTVTVFAVVVAVAVVPVPVVATAIAVFIRCFSVVIIALCLLIASVPSVPTGPRVPVVLAAVVLASVVVIAVLVARAVTPRAAGSGPGFLALGFFTVVFTGSRGRHRVVCGVVVSAVRARMIVRLLCASSSHRHLTGGNSLNQLAFAKTGSTLQPLLRRNFAELRELQPGQIPAVGDIARLGHRYPFVASPARRKVRGNP